MDITSTKHWRYVRLFMNYDNEATYDHDEFRFLKSKIISLNLNFWTCHPSYNIKGKCETIFLNHKF